MAAVAEPRLSGSGTPLSRMRRAAAGIAAAILTSLFLAPAFSAEELEPVTRVEGIREYRLENGLLVLLFPDPSAGTVTVNVTYKVGSRHEGRGEAGMAHLLEHMVFKGTPTTPDIWEALEQRGARFNGTTWVDRTNYYETLPASRENLRFALELEADRMVHSSIRAEDLETEMTVVRNEFEAGENDPRRILRQRVLSAAYLWHPYGRPTIGNRSDIERVPIERLRRFYETYYQPDNAMLVVAGRFDESFALDVIQETFGKIPRPERELRETYTTEPAQDGPRRVELRRTGKVASAALAYHVPAGPHRDTPAIEVLGEILTGEPGGKLYELLVASGRATAVYHSAYAWHDPGLFMLYADSAPGENPGELKESLIQATEQAAGSITDAEVERARNKLLKDQRLAFADSRRIAIALSDAWATGDWRLLFLHRDGLRDVTAEDVKRVASAYLTGNNRTAGIFVPTDGPQRAEIPAVDDLAARLEGYTGSEETAQGETFEATAENIERSTRRTQTGGIELALLPKQTRGGIVRAQLRLGYGTEESLREHVAALELLPELMMRGSTTRDYAGLRSELDRLQAELSLSGEPGTLDVRLQAPRETLPDTLRLLAEMLRSPELPQDQLELVRSEQIAQIERARTDPQGVLFHALYRALEPFPPSSIHYRPTFDEQIARLRAVKRDELTTLHAKHLSADHAWASFVGDFDPDALQALLAELFGDWHTESPWERIEQPFLPIESADRTLDTPDKEMTVVARGTAIPLLDTDPDYPALRFANYVFGQSPSSRLMTELRQERGLSYGTGSFLRAGSEDASAEFVAYAICAPQNAAETQRVIRAETDRLLAEPLPSDVLGVFVTGYTERFRTRLSDDATVARQLVEDLRLKRPFTFHRDVVQAASELTPDQIRAALRKHLAETPFIDLKAGDTRKFASSE